MKKLIPFFWLALALTACAPQTPAGRLDKWTLQREGSAQRFQVTVPNTVAGALNQAGYFGPAILEKEAYKAIDKSIFDDAWVYTTLFGRQKGMRHVLRFEGLNFYADIELNGQPIATSDTCFGTFAVREFDVTPLLKRQNRLKVTLRRAQSGDLNHGFADWNPRPLDESMGIIRPVTLICTPDVQVADVYVKPIVDPDNLSEARVLVNSFLVNRSEHAADGEVSGVFEGGSFSVPVHLEAGESKEVSAEVEVEDPRIWWTREMGSPELYHLDVSFQAEGRVSHHRSVRFGIRSITGEIDPFGHRLFKLNGQPVLVKAGGWSDDLLMQDTAESIGRQLELSADMGLNCIRFENIWGTEDTVYDLCDSLGLMAMVGWSCQWEWESYCGLPEVRHYGCINDERSEALAVRYFHDQLIRLRNHPAVIGWLTGSDCIPNPRLEKQYLALYEALDYRPYVCSASSLGSLAGPSGMKMEGPYEYVGPDYWWVDTRRGGAYGFNTETGPGLNLPQEGSLRRMLGAELAWPLEESVWDYHCTASNSYMNNTDFLEEAMAASYGEATDLQDFIRKAHAMDYDSTRSMYEAFRGNLPNTTGIVMWMLNSAWPSLYWQLFDWYGVPTAGYFGTKTACLPLQLVFNYAGNSVYAVNDVQPDTPLEARLRVFAADGKTLLRDETRQVVSRARQPEKVFEGIAGPCFVALDLDGQPANFYCIPAKNNVYDWDSADWWGLNMLEHADMRFVSALPEARLQMACAPAGDGLDVTLTNTSETLAYQNILTATGPDGLLVPGVVWDHNFVTLLPGESRTLHARVPEGTAIGFSGWNGRLAE